MEAAFPASSRTTQRFPISYVELGSTASRVGPLAVSGVPVVHTPGSEALALRVESGGVSVAYSGDTEWTDALLEISRDADLFICEAYSFEEPISFHLSHASVMAHRSEITARRIVLTHLGAETLAHNSELDIEAAADGARIVLNARA